MIYVVQHDKNLGVHGSPSSVFKILLPRSLQVILFIFVLPFFFAVVFENFNFDLQLCVTTPTEGFTVTACNRLQPTSGNAWIAAL